MNPRLSNWQTRSRKFADLNCRLIFPETSNQPNRIVVLLHGYGAPGDDLVGLAEPIIQRLPESDQIPVFVFPEGLVDLAQYGIPGGRAWWPLNMARLMALNEKGDFSEMRDEIPPGIDEARSTLCACISELLSDFTLSTADLTLGGFSQGAMLTTDTALRGLTSNPRELFIMSGALICESLWRGNASKLKGLPITQSHGTYDMVLPIQTGRWLNELYKSSQAQIAYFEFDGPHTIPFEMIVKIASSLR